MLCNWGRITYLGGGGGGGGGGGKKTEITLLPFVYIAFDPIALVSFSNLKGLIFLNKRRQTSIQHWQKLLVKNFNGWKICEDYLK